MNGQKCGKKSTKMAKLENKLTNNTTKRKPKSSHKTSRCCPVMLLYCDGSSLGLNGTENILFL